MISFDFTPEGITQITLILLFLLYNIVCAVVTTKVLQYKGYEDTPGWTIGALFFGVFVLIGAVGLPLADEANLPRRSEAPVSQRD